MKKFALGLGLILLAVTLFTVGCAKPAATPPPAAVQPKVTVTQGPLADVNVPKSTVTVETPQGPKAFPITPQTTITFQGKACTLDQLAELEASGDNFDCTVVYDADGNVAALNVYRLPPPASFRGTISDVNIKESTITVKTASGDKVVEVDPETGLLIGGVACSLELVNALVDAGGNLACTVIASADNLGNALYIDIASPPNLTAVTGTLEKVDIQKSTVTIQTDKGERTFEVNAKTGEFLNGEVCTLAQIEQANELGEPTTGCEVLVYTDSAGKLVYLDIRTTTAK